ncbi:sensor histidine kinase [Winogradskyella sp.]|uniref:sensor histidine kinase n=1 Tax=Winogradskyella sp. TaxID=1883156 RepID=UPI00260844E5|nr:histidine kinase [Winogradskyella sp.]
MMLSKGYLKKIGLRFLVINVVFLAIKFFVEKDPNESYLNNTTVFYYISTFILFMTTWEVNDWLIKKSKNTSQRNELITNAVIFFITILFVLSLAAIIYYLGIFEFKSLCQIETDEPWKVFKIDMFRALGLASVFSVFNQFYWVYKDKRTLELSLLELKKEITTSKYNSLKSQISPHFLFNSLNTLTSLMYEDRDLASDFVTRLATCYRYILDNREEDLVGLDKELQFLDAFIFMMKVRHNGAIYINTDITIKTNSVLIPTLSLQMLVENALKHNYYSKEQPITITISVKYNRLVVKNNIRKRIDSETSTKLGLANIKKRYAFYTNKDVIIDEENNTFKVSMPLLNKAEINIKDLTVA